jgi:uncharacterized protein
MKHPHDHLPPTRLPVEALRGLECFNAGAYFEAHEHLETAWRAEAGPLRDLYRGVLQVAVGYLHIQRGNYTGALKLFERSRACLAPFGAACLGINLARLSADRERVEAELRRIGPSHIASFNQELFQPVDYDPAPGGIQNG